MSRNEMTRREREKLKHRQEILDAALHLFSEYGFHNVSMQQVADRSEFSIGTLYNFFDNKEHLYSTLLDELSKKFHHAVTSAVEAGSEETEMLRNFVIAKAEIFCENMEVVRLYFQETSGSRFNFKAGLDEEIKIRYAEFMKKLTTVFANGIKKKCFNNIADPYLLAVALDSLTNAILLGCLDDPENMSYPQDPDVLLNIFFKGLLVS
ncbi:MAG: TetR/AcrR family transcriptional regulator [Acidobacteria bacterium]|nr:MAG: TetR/AcrR family transcriptional regulator [Acidobacteriota bacterium]